MKIRPRLHWGLAIGVTYACFVSATAIFVAFALTQPVELVSADYYRQSLTYDQRIEATRRADELGDAVSVSRSGDGRALIVTVPGKPSGTLTLYRPSSVDADRVVPLAVDPRGVQRIPLDHLAAGRWTLKMAWEAQGVRYYREQPVDVP